MKTDENFMEPLYQRVEEYGNVSYVLFKLKAVEKSTGVISQLVSKAALFLIFTVFVGVVTIGAALWLGEWLEKPYYAFFCIAGFYAVLGVLVHYFMCDLIRKRVMNAIISQMLN